MTFSSGGAGTGANYTTTTNYNTTGYNRGASTGYVAPATTTTSYQAPVVNTTTVHTQPVRSGYVEERYEERAVPVERAVATGAVTHGSVAHGAEEFGEINRPGYQKLYSNNYYQQARSPAPVAEEAHKASKCCGTPCWGLLGCCGLLGVILGMLFGLGVIGSLPSFGLPGFSLPSINLPDIDLPKIPGIDLNGISIGDLEADGKPVAIDGIDYPQDSITVSTRVINYTQPE